MSEYIMPLVTAALTLWALWHALHKVGKGIKKILDKFHGGEGL